MRTFDEHGRITARMPAPLQVDWSLAQSLFQEGLPLTSIAKRTGIPYEGLAKRSKRYGWKQLILPPDSRPISGQPLSAQSARWQTRVLDAANRHLSTVLDKSTPDIDLDDLEKLARILDVTDKTARRTFGLDERHDHVTLHVQSELTQPERHALPAQTDQVVDVETVQDVTKDGTNPVPNPS